MAIIRFKAGDVRRLLRHARKAKRLVSHAKGKRGLLLVGDQGVYLMSVGNPQPTNDDGDSLVAYADGINPDVDDNWQHHKNISWGARDGVQLLPLEPLERALDRDARHLRLDLTPLSVKIVVGVKKDKRVKPVTPILTAMKEEKKARAKTKAKSKTTKQEAPRPEPAPEKPKRTTPKKWRGRTISRSRSFG